VDDFVTFTGASQISWDVRSLQGTVKTPARDINNDVELGEWYPDIGLTVFKNRHGKIANIVKCRLHR